ncbi:hypothetical protein Bbelb_069940 [Branchiostoma belcheri]|nr:hypothetical protein Bbelb_069940 [Branchiostoma belcheri]
MAFSTKDRHRLYGNAWGLTLGGKVVVVIREEIRPAVVQLCKNHTWHGPLSLRLLRSGEEERRENGGRWKEDSVVGGGQSFHKLVTCALRVCQLCRCSCPDEMTCDDRCTRWLLTDGDSCLNPTREDWTRPDLAGLDQTRPGDLRTSKQEYQRWLVQEKENDIVDDPENGTVAGGRTRLLSADLNLCKRRWEV